MILAITKVQHRVTANHYTNQSIWAVSPRVGCYGLHATSWFIIVIKILIVIIIITACPVDGQSIVMSMSVCLFVCLYVVMHISKSTRPNFIKFSVHVFCGHGSVSTINYLRPVLGLLSCFHIMGSVGQNQRQRYVLLSSPDGGIGGWRCCLQLQACYY